MLEPIKKSLFLKILLIGFLIVGLTAVLLLLNKSRSSQKSQRPSEENTFYIPQGATKIQDDVYDLGETTDTNGNKVRKIMIIDQENDEGNDVKGVNTDVLQSTSPSCPNPYIVGSNRPARNYNSHLLAFDPRNSSGLSQTDVSTAINRSVLKWEGAARYNFLENAMQGIIQTSALDRPNGKNEIIFAGMLESTNNPQPSNALGVTFSYIDTASRITESDVVINDIYRFAVNVSSNKYDFESVLLHELGHVAGLGHTTGRDCSHTVMFGAIPIALMKRGLTIDDETAIFNLYNTLTTSPTSTLRLGDVNRDGAVNILDFQLLSNSLGKSLGQVGYNEASDLNRDGKVDILDFQILSNNFGR